MSTGRQRRHPDVQPASTSCERTLAGLAAQTDLDARGRGDRGVRRLDRRHRRVPRAPARRRCRSSACYQPNAGPAAARNRGRGGGRRRLWCCSSTTTSSPTPELVAAHVRHHREPGRRPRRDRSDAHARRRTLSRRGCSGNSDMLYKQYDAMVARRLGGDGPAVLHGNASVARRHLESRRRLRPDVPASRGRRAGVPAGRRGTALRVRTRRGRAALRRAALRRRGWPTPRPTVATTSSSAATTARRGCSTAICREFHDRHRLVRALTRVLSAAPSGSGERSRGARDAARPGLRARPGAERVADMALSAVYNLEYYRGMADELGDAAAAPRLFRRGVGVGVSAPTAASGSCSSRRSATSRTPTTSFAW